MDCLVCAPRLLGLDGAQGISDLVNLFPERQKTSTKTAQHPETDGLTLVLPDHQSTLRKDPIQSRSMLDTGRYSHSF